MNDTEISALQIILNNSVTMQALEKSFRISVGKKLPLVKDQGDLEVGQKYRAYCTAQEILQTAFDDLRSYQTQMPEKKTENHR